ELAASALVGGLHHQLRNSAPSSGTSRLPVLIPLGGIAAVGRRRQGRGAGRVRLDRGSEIVRRRASCPEVVDRLLARIQNDGSRLGIGERTSAALSPDRVRQADDVAEQQVQHDRSGKMRLRRACRRGGKGDGRVAEATGEGENGPSI